MLVQELKLPKDIEIKFYRLSYPILNTSNLPLSGIYQPEQGNSIFPFENKFSNFDIGNLENFFSFNSSFGKVFLHEKLEGLIIFSNNSDNHITIKDLDINIIIEPIKDSKNKKQRKISDVKLPPSGIQIRPRNSFSVKMAIFLDIIGKYMIDINLRVRSIAYNTLYNTLKLKGKVKDSPKEFKIVDGNVESLNNKKLTFDVNYPFKIKELFHNKQLNECFIDIKIKNNTIYPLTICDLFLSPKIKKTQSSKISDILQSNNNNNNQEIINKIPLVQTLEEININEFIPLDKSINNTINNTKYTTLESEEEINLLFKIADSNIYNIEPIFILEIKWLNLFDANIKKFLYEFPNQLNTFNKFYKISVIEKPEGNIIKGQNFNIKLKLETKNPQKKYVITLRQDIMKDDDKSSDREIEIIDIIEKKIELNSNKTFDNFILICKSDIIGNVYLPRLKFLVLEDGGITQSGNTYDTLLFFNCVDN
jgi:hypothetical protein